MTHSNQTVETNDEYFLTLLQEDVTDSEDSENSTESIASDTNENNFVQYDRHGWSDTKDSSDDEEPNDRELSEDINILTSRNGSITWFSKPFKSETVRLETYKSGHPNCDINPQTIKESFELFFNSEMKTRILNNTNANGFRTHKDKWKRIDSTELNAVVGLLILAGVLKAKGQNTRELWEESTGIPRFRATTSYNRFEEILSCMKFDDIKTEESKKKTNPLAPVSEYLKIFSHCCKSCYVASTDICVSQQVYPWRGRSECTKVNKPSELRKFELKFWTTTDASSNYCINTQLCCLKLIDENLEVNQTKQVTNELCSHLYNQGKRITFNALHVDYNLALELLKQNTYLLGTVSKNNHEIPPEILQDGKRKVGSCLFGFTNEVAICSHIPKKYSSLILMSTFHNDTTLDIIKDYSRNKDGVDNLDDLLRTYSTKRKTKRWPMVVFYRTLDIACYNALIIWLSLNPTWNLGKHKRRIFLKQLAAELTETQIQLRATTRGLHRSTKRAIEDSGFTLFKQICMNESLGTCKRKRCHICPRSIDRKSQVTCHECSLPVCKEHSNATVICRTCLQTDECSETDLI